MTFAEALADAQKDKGRIARHAWGPSTHRWLAGELGALHGPDAEGHVVPQPDPAGDDATATDWYEVKP